MRRRDDGRAQQRSTARLIGEPRYRLMNAADGPHHEFAPGASSEPPCHPRDDSAFFAVPGVRRHALMMETGMVGVQLRPARPDDIAFILATERMPGYERMVGRSTEEQHRAALTMADRAYLLGVDAAGERAAFAIVRDLADAHGNVCLLRLAVPLPGRGVGSRFLREVLRWVFAETAAYRLWLAVMPGNARAHHVYASHGFVEEGVMRAAYRSADGTRIDLAVMSLLRPDWLAHPGAAAE
jgi:ribosomal protein S18 acetylase RimI-like enzyme